MPKNGIETSPGIVFLLPPELEDEHRYSGHPVSNDYGYKHIAQELIARVSRVQRGLGFFIGSGGLVSMLPILKIDRPIVVDRDPVVLEVNRVMIDTIVSADTPKEAVQTITRQVEHGEHPAFANLSKPQRNWTLNELIDGIDREAEAYGKYHWTQKRRFPGAQTVLRERPPIWVNGNITSPDTMFFLKTAASQCGRPITFANLSNAHHWLPDQFDMGFMRHWPIVENATIVYSMADSRVSRIHPVMRFTDSVREYITHTREDLL